MIYDCFTFFNELLLLEVRLNTLNSVVDKFVLVESPYTHSGNNKPLYFEQAKDRPEFAKFKNKIIHIIVENIPLRSHWRNENRQKLLKCEPRQPINAKPATGIWQNENHQRRCIKRGLTNLQPDDIVLVSDLDEIPNPDIFPIIQTKQKPCILKQKDYYYYLNCRGRRDVFAAAFCRGRDFIDGHLVRFPEPRIEREIIDNGGWHFGYLMTPENIATKIGSVAATKFDTDFFKDKNRISKCIKAKKDLYGRKKCNSISNRWMRRNT